VHGVRRQFRQDVGHLGLGQRPQPQFRRLGDGTTRGGQQHDAGRQHANQQLRRVRTGAVKIIDQQQARAIRSGDGEAGGLWRQPADWNAPIAGETGGGAQQRGPPDTRRTALMSNCPP
jgi:hypothetical protein